MPGDAEVGLPAELAEHRIDATAFELDDGAAIGANKVMVVAVAADGYDVRVATIGPV